jgi:hypothetical protein
MSDYDSQSLEKTPSFTTCGSSRDIPSKKYEHLPFSSGMATRFQGTVLGLRSIVEQLWLYRRAF